MTRCPKCGRADYDGKRLFVAPDECALEDGIGCRAYRHGVEVGRRQAEQAAQGDGGADG